MAEPDSDKWAPTEWTLFRWGRYRLYAEAYRDRYAGVLGFSITLGLQWFRARMDKEVSLALRLDGLFVAYLTWEWGASGAPLPPKGVPE